MLPVVYQIPAGVVFVLGGAVACFAGHRLFRVVLGIFGFILGALVARRCCRPRTPPRRSSLVSLVA